MIFRLFIYSTLQILTSLREGWSHIIARLDPLKFTVHVHCFSSDVSLETLFFLQFWSFLLIHILFSLNLHAFVIFFVIFFWVFICSYLIPARPRVGTVVLRNMYVPYVKLRKGNTNILVVEQKNLSFFTWDFFFPDLIFNARESVFL